MNDKMKKIESIVETYMGEGDPEVEQAEDVSATLFYGDLDNAGKKKIMDALNSSYEYTDIYEDKIEMQKIIQKFSKIPLFSLTGEELKNLVDVDL